MKFQAEQEQATICFDKRVSESSIGNKDRNKFYEEFVLGADRGCFIPRRRCIAFDSSIGLRATEPRNNLNGDRPKLILGREFDRVCVRRKTDPVSSFLLSRARVLFAAQSRTSLGEILLEIPRPYVIAVREKISFGRTRSNRAFSFRASQTIDSKGGGREGNGNDTGRISPGSEIVHLFEFSHSMRGKSRREVV